MSTVFKISSVSILYILYINFFVSILVNNLTESLVATYFFSGVDIILLLGVSSSHKNLPKNKSVANMAIVVFAFGFFISLSIFNQNHHYSILLAYFMVLMYAFFRTYAIKKKDFIDFVNRTYAVYAIASILVFVFFPNTLYSIQNTEEHHASIFGVKYLVLHSIEGFASTIDSYSALVLLVNIFINDQKSKKFYVVLSLFCVLYSLKMTPLISLLSAFLAFIFVRNRSFAVGYVLSLLIGFVYVTWLLFVNPVIYGVPYDILMYAATHSRSMIWEQQLLVMIKNYTFFDYLFGNYTTDLFAIPAYQLDGTLKKGYEISNPHNTYLLLFFRMPLLFLVFYLFYVKKVYLTYNRKSFVLIAFIFTAFITNAMLISLGNPVFLMVLLYLILQPSNKYRKELKRL